MDTIKLILCLLLIIFACATIGLSVGTFFLAKSAGSDDNTSTQSIVSASKVLERMDVEADPCEDFFTYACGNYRKTQLFDAQDKYAKLSFKTSEYTKSIIPRLFDRILMFPRDEVCDSELKIVRFYHSCMDEFVEYDSEEPRERLVSKMNSIDLQTAEAVREMFLEEFGFELTTRGIATSIDLVQWPQDETVSILLFKFKSVISVMHTDSLYNIFGIQPPSFDELTSLLPVQISSDGSLSLIDESLDYVLSLLFDVSSPLSEDEKNNVRTNVNNSLKSLIQIYEEAAKINATQAVDVTGTSNKQDYSKWITFFSSFGGLLTSWTTNDATNVKIKVANPEFFQLYNESSIANDHGSFMTLQMVGALHYLLFQTNSTYQSGEHMEPLDKELFCLENAFKHSNAFKELTANAYAKYYNGIESFNASLNIIGDLVSEMIKLVENVANLKTRDILKQYISKIKMRRSLESLECSFTDKFIQDLEIDPQGISTFPQNLIKIRQFYQRMHSATGTKQNLFEFFAFGAAYRKDTQEIFDSSFLLGQIFSTDMFAPQQYAELGYMFGHEICHSLDTSGKTMGNFSSWDSETIEEYENFTECLTKFYNKGKIDGSLTLDENYSDVVGTKIAFNAMKNNENMGQLREQLKKSPVLNQFTPEQLFFVSRAQTWCEAYVSFDKTLPVFLTQDHAPFWARVNLALAVNPEFGEAFKCGENSFMTI